MKKKKKCALVRIFLLFVKLDEVKHPILGSFVSFTVELYQWEFTWEQKKTPVTNLHVTVELDQR